MKKTAFMLVVLMFLSACSNAVQPSDSTVLPNPLQTEDEDQGVYYDVVVLGGSSAGVGAAIGAARQGAQVLLIEETNRLGGMISNGVTTDIRRLEAANGIFEEFRKRVALYYEERGQLEESNNGLIAEPDVAESIIREMVNETSGIETWLGYYLKEENGVIVEHLEGHPRVTGITVTNGEEDILLEAGMFIDATHTGDLLGQAGQEDADWRIGRESRDEYGESLAGTSQTGEADKKIQAYNFRFTIQVDGYTEYKVPADYEQNLPAYREVSREYMKKYSCEINGKLYYGMRIQRCLPNNKMDINIDLVGANHKYPTGSYAEREKIRQRLKNFAIGYLHYLRTELDMPELGLTVDDYVDSEHFPTTLYVREGRRMVGVYVFTQNDAVTEEQRPPLKNDSIAIGDYGVDSHCIGPPPDPDSYCEGGFWRGTKPYQVPYGVIIPKNIDGLLVPVAVSATHVGFSTLRMEPVRINLGFASGVAATLALQDNSQPRRISVKVLQELLVSGGQMLIFFDDLPASHQDFEAIQLLATQELLEVYSDYSIRPDSLTTRTMLEKLLGKQCTTGPCLT